MGDKSMGDPLLKDPDVFPSAEVLEEVLGRKYAAFREFMNAAESEEFGLKPEWRYYNDGKAWLCKISRKKKTVAWLSVYSDCFKVVFYFTEKSGIGIPGLDISDSLIEGYLNHEPIGKLKPLVVEVRQKSQVSDVSTLLSYRIEQL
jgi:hypothetical protein